MKAELHHSYGPAECSIAATEWKCDPAAVDSIVHIGRPLSNIQIYILDMYLQPVPRGVTGELWIAGVALARGYLNRPDLTAERFIPSPFGTEPGLRMYGTGDLARYRCDGNIEYTGRIDEQIKIRGFRIELGEIQTVLCSHPAVEQTVVIAREERTGKQLVAYVAAKAAAADLSGEELKEFLGTCLPAFMIPANFVFLDVFPLTANGKVNRAALPSPEAIRMDRSFIPPQTACEKILAELESEVLGGGKIGIENNFFELGGDSILSIQVVARAGRRGLHLKPKDLFDHQTIRDLAGVVGTAPAAQEDQGEVVGEVPLTPIQRWFFEQEFVELHHYNQSVLLRVREGVQKEHVERVVRELVKHHDALRLRYTRGAEGGWEQHNAGVTSERDGRFTEKHLKKPGAEEQRAVLEETVNRVQASLDLERGPLVRVVLFELGAVGGMRLLIVVHHLAMDGVSWRILLEDLERGYEQARSGEAISFGAKTSSFRQWARRIEEYGSSGRMREEAGYWLGVAERSREVEKLPVDHEDGRNARGSVGLVGGRFSA